jgi:hypothetical protein
MTNVLNVSLDLETWGTRPGFDLRSIGACVFAPTTRHGGPLIHDGSLGTIRPFYVACDNPLAPNAMYNDDRKYPLKRDPQTVQWWTEQSDEAQAAFADPIDLRMALDQFGQWLTALMFPHPVSPWTAFVDPSPDTLRLWSHGAAFDPGILAEAYHAVGLPVPWHYRAPRDTRTAFDLAGIEDHSAWLAQHPGPLGLMHHALDDAICQARAVCAAMARLRLPDDVVTHRKAWRDAIARNMDESAANIDGNDADYYSHELRAYDRTFDNLAEYPHLVDNP